MTNEGRATIRIGARGDDVRHLQRALRALPNPAVVVDGIFGPVTEAAVKLAQQEAGLVPDGVVGPATWAALPDGGPEAAPLESETGTEPEVAPHESAHGTGSEAGTEPAV